DSNPTTLDFWQESIASLMKTFRPGDTFATTGGISGINATIDRTEFLSDRAIEPIDQFHPLTEQFVVRHSLRHPSLQDLVHRNRLHAAVLFVFQVGVVDHLSQHSEGFPLQLEFAQQGFKGALIAVMPEAA